MSSVALASTWTKRGRGRWGACRPLMHRTLPCGMSSWTRRGVIALACTEQAAAPGADLQGHRGYWEVKPSNLFVQLLDYSKDEKGNPTPDLVDGMLYGVIELAQYSLKDFLADRREKQKPLSIAQFWCVEV
mmetsp:Transcript_132095/g.423171  ORF Transcript_132095/g.423171 Transcript_132095/m.423171 type:complete len:131 (+) Transcript_132095:49-441(+)